MSKLATALSIVAAVALGAAVPAMADVTKVTCTGEATMEPIGSTYEVREAGEVTVTSFDFTGSHSFCDRDGNRVEGTWSGHLVQIAAPYGTTTIHVQGTDVFLGGTLDVTGQITIANGNWISSARAGNGTGALEGVTTHQVEIYPTANPGLLAFRTTIFWP